MCDVYKTKDEKVVNNVFRTLARNGGMIMMERGWQLSTSDGSFTNEMAVRARSLK